MRFLDNFKRICKDKGTTPTTVLKSIGESSNKLGLWKKGSIPKEDMMIRLAQKLGCSVMDFFADDDSTCPTRIETTPANDDEEDILRIYRSLSRRARHEFMTTVYRFEKENELIGDKDSDQSSAL